MPQFSRWISAPEVRLALRMLRRQPVMTITTVLALAVGIGMATTGFALLDSVLYSKLPFPNGDRFVVLEASAQPQGTRTTIDEARFSHFSSNSTSFEHIGAVRDLEVTFHLDSGELVPVRAAMITSDSGRAFPHRPLLGRGFVAEDSLRGAAPVALLRESLWRRHFSADGGVVGRMAFFSGVRRTIVGVMPDAFEFPNSPEVWLPLTSHASAMTFGVLRPGVMPSAAGAEIAALSAQFEAAVPAAEKLRVDVYRFTEALSRGLGLMTSLMVGALVLVLLVIAANIGNLVLARTHARSRELAVRTALGATRGRLVRQIFAEVMLLGVLAAAIGLGASEMVLRWLNATVPEMPFWVEFTSTPRTMLFVASVTLLASAIGGIVPALKATRGNTSAALATTTRTASGGLGKGAGLMVAVQVAVSIALLNGALLMARGVAGYMNPTLRIPASEVLTARVFTETQTREAMVDAVAQLPGVAAAGASTSLPGLSPAPRMVEIESFAGSAPTAARPAPVVAADAGYFATFGAKAHRGRLFQAADLLVTAPPVVVVNDPFVQKFFGGADPIGRRLRIVSAGANGTVGAWHEIVGVVPDLGLSVGDEKLAAGFYLPLQSEQLFHLSIRAAGGEARGLAGALRTAINRIDPGAQVRDVVALTEVGREDRAVFAGIGAALGALGGMALLLSVIGTYAILSLAVTRRTREIGIRTALGATRRQVLQAIVGRVAIPPAIGAAAGMLLGQLLVSARGIFAFRLPESSGPWGLPLLAALMVASGLFAAWVPARKALAVEPMDALRAE